MPESKPWCGVVMPCLNEQDRSARYLPVAGLRRFPRAARAVFPVLVDNGSTDRTPDVCRALESETRRRRHRGTGTRARLRPSPPPWQPNRRARCPDPGISYETLVVIQTDADATYSPGYVDTVRGAMSDGAADSRIGQAITARMPDLELRYPSALSEVDAVHQGVKIHARSSESSPQGRPADGLAERSSARTASQEAAPMAHVKRSRRSAWSPRAFAALGSRAARVATAWEESLGAARGEGVTSR